MKINVQVFGMLTEVMGANTLEMETISKDSSEFAEELTQKYPQLANITCKWAVNNQMVEGKVRLNNNDNIAIFPPFSGG